MSHGGVGNAELGVCLQPPQKLSKPAPSLGKMGSCDSLAVCSCQAHEDFIAM